MKDLTSKDITLEWFRPTSKRGNYRDSDDSLLVVCNIKKNGDKYKYDNMYLKFPQAVLDKHYPEDVKEYRIAFSFDKGAVGKDAKLIVVFNPGKGIPYLKMNKNVTTKTLSVKSLIDNIYDFLGLSKETTKYYLKIHYFAKINGIELHVLTPHDYTTGLPLWVEEGRGELDLHK